MIANLNSYIDIDVVYMFIWYDKRKEKESI